MCHARTGVYLLLRSVPMPVAVCTAVSICRVAQPLTQFPVDIKILPNEGTTVTTTVAMAASTAVAAAGAGAPAIAVVVVAATGLTPARVTRTVAILMVAHIPTARIPVATDTDRVRAAVGTTGVLGGDTTIVIQMTPSLGRSVRIAPFISQLHVLTTGCCRIWVF